MEEYIVNAFDYEYSNGRTEGMNNLIKQINHTACDYRKFKHLKAGIMLKAYLIQSKHNKRRSILVPLISFIYR